MQYSVVQACVPAPGRSTQACATGKQLYFASVLNTHYSIKSHSLAARISHAF